MSLFDNIVVLDGHMVVISGGFIFMEVAFEVLALDKTFTNNSLCVLRVGWSHDIPDLSLGENATSWGYGGTAKKSYKGDFKQYGDRYGPGDSIICYVDFEGKTMHFSKNGKNFGTAFKLTDSDLSKPLFPSVSTKNVKFLVNFGQQPTKHPLQDGYKMIAFASPDTIHPCIRGPGSLAEAEFLCMVGLPAAGKTTWAAKHAAAHPDKRYNILGTNMLMEKMKLFGLARERNYHGRWDELIDRATKILNTLFKMIDKKLDKFPRNIILDQTNVYESARKRKLGNFVKFGTKVAVVIVNNNAELGKRTKKREGEEGKLVPEHAVMGMKANFVLPKEREGWNRIDYIEASESTANDLVRGFNMEGKRYTKEPSSGGTSSDGKKFADKRTQDKPPFEDRLSKKPRTDQGPTGMSSRVSEANAGRFNDTRKLNTRDSFDRVRGGSDRRSGSHDSRGRDSDRRGRNDDSFSRNRGPIDEGRGDRRGATRFSDRDHQASSGNRRDDDRRSSGFDRNRGGGGGYDDGKSSSGDRNRRGFNDNRGGFNSNRGGFSDNRGGFNDNRGGFNDNRGGFNDNRGGFNDNRGGFNDNRGGFNDNRGGFNDNRGGPGDNSRGGFDNNRGGPGDSRSGFNDNRSGFNNNRGGPGDNRSGFNDNRSGFNDNRSGFNENRTGFNDNRGGYNNNRGGLNDSRGGFGDNRGGFNDNRGGYNNNRTGPGDNRSGPGDNRERRGYDNNQVGYAENRGAEGNRNNFQPNRSSSYHDNRSTGYPDNRTGQDGNRQSGFGDNRSSYNNNTATNTARGNFPDKSNFGDNRNTSHENKTGFGTTGYNEGNRYPQPGYGTGKGVSNPTPPKRDSAPTRSGAYGEWPPRQDTTSSDASRSAGVRNSRWSTQQDNPSQTTNTGYRGTSQTAGYTAPQYSYHGNKQYVNTSYHSNTEKQSQDLSYTSIDGTSYNPMPQADKPSYPSYGMDYNRSYGDNLGNQSAQSQYSVPKTENVSYNSSNLNTSSSSAIGYQSYPAQQQYSTQSYNTGNVGYVVPHQQYTPIQKYSTPGLPEQQSFTQQYGAVAQAAAAAASTVGSNPPESYRNDPMKGYQSYTTQQYNQPFSTAPSVQQEHKQSYPYQSYYNTS